MMKEKIIAKATEMFLKLGFKSITMDDIACEMCISKKTIYKYFINKEVLIEESTETLHRALHQIIEAIIAQDHSPIRENFEIRKLIRDTFMTADTSPLYQLKKHYPEMHCKVMSVEKDECQRFLRQNMLRGIALKLYRENLDVERYINFYYVLLFHINENTVLEKDAQDLEMSLLEYHTRAIATAKGIAELENLLALNI